MLLLQTELSECSQEAQPHHLTQLQQEAVKPRVCVGGGMCVGMDGLRVEKNDRVRGEESITSNYSCKSRILHVRT